MNFFTDYRFPGVDDVRSLTALPNDDHIAICSCGMNHSFCNPGKEDILYVLETRSPFKCRTESSWVGTVRNLQSLVLYRYPYIDDVKSIYLLRDNSCISVCSCGMNHSYSGKYIEAVGGKCKTPISWCGNVGDLKKRITDLVNSQNILHTENNQKREQANKNSPESKQNNSAAEFAIKDSEISLLLAIRKEYEKPPDKGIVAALLIPMWLRKQRMPLCNTDSLFELYDVPAKR